MKEKSKENKYQKYIELIQALLECAEGEEAQILAANENLIDKSLLEAIAIVAANLDEQEEGGGNWLRNLGQYLTQYIENPQATQSHYDFLLKILQTIANEGEKEEVYALLQQNLDKLDLKLAYTLQDWADKALSQTEELEAKKSLGYLIWYFSIFIHNFPLGNRASNIEISIISYNILLIISTQEYFPVDWAITQNNLGNAYSDRIKGDRAENIEQAVTAYQQALTIYTQEYFPVDWAMTQNNLGNAYSDRIKGDKAENIENAISAYQKALMIRTQQDFPVDWAMTQNNLATAYSNRIKGDKAENIENAILAYQNSLMIRTQQEFPVDWAMTQNNLATAYSNRIKGDKDENLEKAIAYYQNALTVYTQAHFPYEWAMIQNNLANAYSDRIEGDKDENLEKAIACYQNALTIYTQAHFPYEWAMIQNNLGNVYTNRIEGDKTENTIRASKYYQNALLERTPQNNPIECFRTAKSLGELYFTQENWQLAVKSYSLAIEAIEQSREWASNDQSKQEIISSAIEAHQNIVIACINLGKLEKALEYVERSKALNLADLLAVRSLYPKGNIPQDIITRLDSLRQEIINEERRLRLKNNLADTSHNNTFENNQELVVPKISNNTFSDRTHLNNLRQQLERLIAEYIQPIDPFFQLNQSVKPLTFSQITTTIENSQTAILYFYTTHDATYIFIIKQDKIDLQISQNCGHNNFQNWILENWLLLYTQERKKWVENICSFLDELSNILNIAKLVSNYLSEIEELIIVPHLYLHLIPFAALPISPNIKTFLSETRPNLLDLFRICYVPSCQILKLCQERLLTNTTRDLGIVGNPTDDLFASEIECDEIARIYHVSKCNYLLSKKGATATNFRKLLERVQLLHFSGHGFSRLDNPLESFLLLGDANITLDEILTYRLPNLQQVFLSSCESGMSNITLTDDVFNIGTGFLLAGASNVCSTLWAVDDLATAIFSIFYYQYLKDDFPDCPAALQKAQHRLKHLSGEELKQNYSYFHEYLTIQFQQATMYRRKIKEQLKQLSKETSEYKQLAAEKSYWIQAENNIHLSIKHLKRSMIQDRPFANPYYWAGFISQGLN